MRLEWRTGMVGLAAGAVLLAGAAPPAGAMPSAATAAADAQAVYRTINRERAAHAVPALHWNTRLASAAHAHDLAMAKYNTLSHQVTGERSLGGRVTAAGYAWHAVAENIGCGTDWSEAGVLAMQRMMYHETPPNDGHRRNILSKAYRAVGVDVYMDARHHKFWLTEVFASPA